MRNCCVNRFVTFSSTLSVSAQWSGLKTAPTRVLRSMPSRSAGSGGSVYLCIYRSFYSNTHTYMQPKRKTNPIGHRPAVASSKPSTVTSWTKPSEGTARDDGGGTAPLVNKNLGSSSGASTSRKKLQDVDISLLDTLDTIEDPNVSSYMFHEMQTISDKIIRSMRVHNLMHIYATKMICLQWSRVAADMDKMLNTLIQGKTIYIRVIDLNERSASGKGDDSGATPHAHEQTGIDGDGDAGAADGDGKRQDSQANDARRTANCSSAQARQYVFDHIKTIVSRYTYRTLEPFFCEMAFDVSYYATYMPLINAARKAVDQLQMDVERFIHDQPPSREGYSGTPAKHVLQPLCIDSISKDIASLIQREIFTARAESDVMRGAGDSSNTDCTTQQSTTGLIPSTLSNGSEPSLRDGETNEQAKPDGEGEKVATPVATDAPAATPQETTSARTHTMAQRMAAQYEGLRVCVGVATTPMLAKIACDVEVATLLRADGGNVSRVRVRSFYRHVLTPFMAKKFLAPFHIAQLPCVRPDFARLLSEGIGIVTCADVVKRFSQLCFSVNADVFRYCYRLVHGLGQFDEERRVVIFSPDHAVVHDKMLVCIASNAISLVNTSRTAYQENSTLKRIISVKRHGLRLPMIDAQLNYGRLITDEQFMDVLRRTVSLAVARLHKKSQAAGSIKLMVRPIIATRPTFVKTFPVTDDHDTIMGYALETGHKLAPYRHHVDYESGDKVYTVHVTLSSLEQAPILPIYIMDEVEKIKTLSRECRAKLVNSELYLSRQRRLNRQVDKLKKMRKKEKLKLLSGTSEGERKSRIGAKDTTSARASINEDEGGGSARMRKAEGTTEAAATSTEYTASERSDRNDSKDSHRNVRILI